MGSYSTSHDRFPKCLLILHCVRASKRCCIPTVLFCLMKGRPGMPQCGFSAKAAGILQALGVEYAHVNVLDDQEIREGIKRYGDWPTIPQLYIDGELIGER